MRAHTIRGAEILAEIAGLAHLAPLVRASHERWDGTGYPDRLFGEQIPLAARIVFTVDAFDAMTNDRPYRRALGHEEARRRIAPAPAPPSTRASCARCSRRRPSCAARGLGERG